jgi:hypothetical protein
MLINVDQLWKPASNPPDYSGQFYCRVRHLLNNETKASIVRYHYREKTEEGWWEMINNWAVEYWMENLPAPGVGNLMEIPSEATLQLYGDDSELTCIKVEPREGQSGAAIAVLIRTNLSTRLTGSANEDGPPPEPEGWVDDEVVVSMQAYDSQNDNAQWRNRTSLSFGDAKYNLEREIMLISVDNWKSANEHPANSGFHYCIAETPSGCEFRPLLFFSIVHKAWEGVDEEDTVKFWLPHIPSPSTLLSPGSGSQAVRRC